MSHEEMAIALGISRNTLEKHFEAELSVGALQRRMEILQAMHSSAKRGNVAAQKAYIAMTPTPAAPPVPAPTEEDAAPKPRLGKKAQAQADATTAAVGTDWDSLLNKGSATRPPIQ